MNIRKKYKLNLPKMLLGVALALTPVFGVAVLGQRNANAADISSNFTVTDFTLTGEADGREKTKPQGTPLSDFAEEDKLAAGYRMSLMSLVVASTGSGTSVSPGDTLTIPVRSTFPDGSAIPGNHRVNIPNLSTPTSVMVDGEEVGTFIQRSNSFIITFNKSKVITHMEFTSLATRDATAIFQDRLVDVTVLDNTKTVVFKAQPPTRSSDFYRTSSITSSAGTDSALWGGGLAITSRNALHDSLGQQCSTDGDYLLVSEVVDAVAQPAYNVHARFYLPVSGTDPSATNTAAGSVSLRQYFTEVEQSSGESFDDFVARVKANGAWSYGWYNHGNGSYSLVEYIGNLTDGKITLNEALAAAGQVNITEETNNDLINNRLVEDPGDWSALVEQIYGDNNCANGKPPIIWHNINVNYGEVQAKTKVDLTTTMYSREYPEGVTKTKSDYLTPSSGGGGTIYTNTPLKAALQIENSSSEPNPDFSFTITPELDSPNPSITTVTLNEDGELDFGTVRLDAVGTYRYVINQTDISGEISEDWQLDLEPMVMEITTSFDGTNLLISDVKYYKGDEEVESLIFTNVYEEKSYTVTYVDEDGTILQGPTVVKEGDPEPEAPADPSKPADESYTYEFAGWEKAVDADGNITYTATYTATPIPAPEPEPTPEPTPESDDDVIDDVIENLFPPLAGVKEGSLLAKICILASASALISGIALKKRSERE